MRTMAWCHCILVAALLAIVSWTRGEALTLGEVLDRVDVTQAASRRFHVQDQTLGTLTNSLNGETSFFRSRIDMFVDGDRLDVTYKSWELKDRNAVPADRDAQCRREIWDGKTYSDDMWNERQGDHRRTISSPKQDLQEGLDRAMHNRSLMPTEKLLGMFYGDVAPFGSIIRSADPAKCGVRQADWKGSDCVLLEASTRSGQYRVWLDPQHGYRAVHATVQKEAGDECYGARLDRPMLLPRGERERIVAGLKEKQLPSTPHRRLTFEMEVTRFGQQQGIWWSMEGNWTVTWEYEEGAREVTTAQYTCTMVDLAPDFVKLHAFERPSGDGIEVRIEPEMYTTLMSAAGGSPDPEKIAPLLKAGAQVNAMDANGSTPLMFAAEHNPNPEVTAVLLKAGAEVNATDKRGMTPLMMGASENPNPDVIAVLIAAGADVNAKDKKGWTALLYAARYTRDPKVIVALLKAGGDVNAKTEYGLTPLMFAAGYASNPEVVTALVGASGDVNAKATMDGEMPLMFAAESNPKQEVIAALVKAGADINAKDDMGRSVIEYGRRNRNPEVLAELVRAGAK